VTAGNALGPDAELFIVFNDIFPGSGFGHYENQQVFTDIKRLSENVNLTRIHMPHCDSQLMEYGRSLSMSPLAIFKHSERLAEEMHLGRIAANTEKRRMLQWISEVQEELTPLFTTRRSSQPARAEMEMRQDSRQDQRPELRSVASHRPADRTTAAR
jgi:hypothetical protein